MNFKLRFVSSAVTTLETLQRENPAKYRKVLKTLGLMETNLRHPSLKTHKYTTLKGENGEEVFESYVENKTPGAFRLFWHYGPNNREITILAITPHP
ncbi:MAG: hypothetical protein GC158_17550 [Cyanobacteria bacterium RI_101]|nr:hypothetical protein [Cyanobacteria bacterium RI_101]